MVGTESGMIALFRCDEISLSRWNDDHKDHVHTFCKYSLQNKYVSLSISEIIKKDVSFNAWHHLFTYKVSEIRLLCTVFFGKLYVLVAWLLVWKLVIQQKVDSL